MSDEEKGIQKHDEVGFAEVSNFIAADKEHTASLFNRFEKLGARNLMYLQSELRAFELQLSRFDAQDAQGSDWVTAMDWQYLCDRADQGDVRAVKRVQLVLKIREKVKEYREY